VRDKRKEMTERLETSVRRRQKSERQTYFSVVSLRLSLTFLSSPYVCLSLFCRLLTLVSHFSVVSLRLSLTFLWSPYTCLSLFCHLLTLVSHLSVISLRFLSLFCRLLTLVSHFSVVSLHLSLTFLSSP
jgi:hypothetical protein